MSLWKTLIDNFQVLFSNVCFYWWVEWWVMPRDVSLCWSGLPHVLLVWRALIATEFNDHSRFSLVLLGKHLLTLWILFHSKRYQKVCSWFHVQLYRWHSAGGCSWRWHKLGCFLVWGMAYTFRSLGWAWCQGSWQFFCLLLWLFWVH